MGLAKSREPRGEAASDCPRSFRKLPSLLRDSTGLTVRSQEGFTMGLPNGLHHIAICTKDIKGQIEFYTQVVGMELCALYWMHGVDNTFHAFLRIGTSPIAFSHSPDTAELHSITHL